VGAEDRYVRSEALADCPTPHTDVGCDAAFFILEPYFKAAQEQFVAHEREHFGHKQLARVRMECRPWLELQRTHGFTVRNFAATRDDGRVIVVAPELIELPEENVAAVLAHEFGHAYDFLYPARFVLRDGDLLRFDDVPSDDRRADQARFARMRAWRERDHNQTERLADAIASDVLRREIRYSGPCLLQGFGAGSERPEGLQ
jgi:hypothetical protein